ncbi:cytochrome c [Flavivirga aquimarina]|uniref:Cytochrome c n=1 Tax=Flavivirga aquimarina TaxID=2027862 RepID=A0ABT8WEV6_9FLAO|nr:cytochrome c [Flavivirga aquimarina]MDO5971702.1 cytochrome c [Flavivirga aquimarina]
MKLIAISLFALLFIFNSNTNLHSPQDPLKESIERGNEIYTDFCMSCHLPNGEGVENVYPPLAKSDYLIKKREESIRGIKYGLEGEIVVNGITYNSNMAALGLSDDEVADVMNYITNSWGNKNNKIVTEEEVKNIKK